MRIRVVFLRDVPPKYQAGDIREVAGGYARNYLIPTGVAAPAIGDHLKGLEKVKRTAEVKRVKETEDMELLARHLEGAAVEVKVRASEAGRLYGSVTAARIAEELTLLLERSIDRRFIQLQEPIKDVGIFEIPVRLYPGLEPMVTVLVEAEGQPIAVSEAAEAVSGADEAAPEGDDEEPGTSKSDEPSAEETGVRGEGPSP